MRDLIKTLALALDHDDYTTARTALSDDVRYEVKGEVLRGPDAVLQSYEQASIMAHELFDAVGYDHEIGEIESDQITVDYTDALTIGDETLVHHARQIYTVDPDRGVIEIVNVELPGESAKVDEFLARHGKSR